MRRFYGKYRFIIDNRKLVFWENRLGLIGKDRTTIRDKNNAMVPLPPECCMFLAISRATAAAFCRPATARCCRAIWARRWAWPPRIRRR